MCRCFFGITKCFSTLAMSSGALSNQQSSRAGKTKSGRNVQFSHQQNVVLIDKILEVYDVIFGKKARITPQSRKINLWERISDEVSAVGPFKKSIINCKKRYGSIKKCIKTKLRKERRISRKKGRLPSYELNLLDYEQKLFEVIGQKLLDCLEAQHHTGVLLDQSELAQQLAASSGLSTIDQQSSTSSSSIEGQHHFSSTDSKPDPCSSSGAHASQIRDHLCDIIDSGKMVPSVQPMDEDHTDSDSSPVDLPVVEPRLTVNFRNAPPVAPPTVDPPVIISARSVISPVSTSLSAAIQPEDRLMSTFFQSAEEYRAEQQQMGYQLNENLCRLVAVHEEQLQIEKQTLELLSQKLEEDSRRNDLLYALLENVISITHSGNGSPHLDSTNDRGQMRTNLPHKNEIKKESNGV